MARLNRDMERAAIEELAPAPDDHVLTVGFGPGVGIAELVPRVPDGGVAGVDPSRAMVDQARRRNRAAIREGRVRLEQAGAVAIPWADATFRGVLAVNNLQLWDPLDASLREVARVLGAGGALVTVTHCWSIEKRGPLNTWLDTMTRSLEGAGFADPVSVRRPFRSGEGLVLRARRARWARRAGRARRD